MKMFLFMATASYVDNTLPDLSCFSDDTAAAHCHVFVYLCGCGDDACVHMTTPVDAFEVCYCVRDDLWLHDDLSTW